MLPGFDLAHIVQTAGPWVALLLVAIIIFSESGLLVGFFLPGDSILFTVGVLLQGGSAVHLSLNVLLVLAVIFVAAAAGDSVGYGIGYKTGPLIFKRPNSLLFRHENLERAQAFYERYGGKTIIIARFIPVVRTFVPVVAGAASMTYRTFLAFNVIGALLWSSGVIMVGYFLGAFLQHIGINVDTVILPIITLIVIASIAPPIIHILKDKERRKSIWDFQRKLRHRDKKDQ